MSTLRKWTEDEEKVVISKIEENPNNLQKHLGKHHLKLAELLLLLNIDGIKED